MIRSRKRWFRILKRTLVSFLALFIILAFSVLGTVDYTHYTQQPYYKTTLTKIDSLQYERPVHGSTLRVGWARENITPTSPCNLAGYGNRGNYESVKDSIYSKVILLDNGVSRVAIVALDLIMVSPALEVQLDSAIKASDSGIDGVYYTATHSHSSIGHIGKSYGAGYVMGEYRQDICDIIVNKTLKALKTSSLSMDTCSIANQSIDVSGYVHNRLVYESPDEGNFRVLFFKKQNGEKLLFSTYSAHPTILGETSKVLSNDYVGYLNMELKRRLDLDMVVFAAGAVGSHAPSTWNVGVNDEKDYGRILASLVVSRMDSIRYDSVNQLAFCELPLELGEPQLRSRYFYGFRLRPWVFNNLMQDVNAQMKFMRIGEIFFAGTPCDFSGEFYQKIANDLDLNPGRLFITSFNGGYIGYAIPSKYYQIKHSETHEMNWFGPFTGDYFAEAIVKSGQSLNRCK